MKLDNAISALKKKGFQRSPAPLQRAGSLFTFEEFRDKYWNLIRIGYNANYEVTSVDLSRSISSSLEEVLNTSFESEEEVLDLLRRRE